MEKKLDSLIVGGELVDPRNFRVYLGETSEAFECLLKVLDEPLRALNITVEETKPGQWTFTRHLNENMKYLFGTFSHIDRHFIIGGEGVSFIAIHPVEGYVDVVLPKDETRFDFGDANDPMIMVGRFLCHGFLPQRRNLTEYDSESLWDIKDSCEVNECASIDVCYYDAHNNHFVASIPYEFKF